MNVIEQYDGSDASDDYEIVVEKRRNIRRSVYAAFANNEYPGDVVVLDNFDMHSTNPFVGRDWRDVVPEIVQGYFSVPLFWGREAFQYYLPAFILGGLTYDWFDNIALVFIPPCCPDSFPFVHFSGYFRDCFESLLEEQYECIRIFLKYAAETSIVYTDETYTCMRTYWEKPYFPVGSDAKEVA